MYHWTAEHCLSQYDYWSRRARENAARLGHDSESYRAAMASAMRWLGRHDVLVAS